MTNPMMNPNYSGVTIQIANPAVNLQNPDRNKYGQQSCNHTYCCAHPQGHFNPSGNNMNNYTGLPYAYYNQAQYGLTPYNGSVVPNQQQQLEPFNITPANPNFTNPQMSIPAGVENSNMVPMQQPMQGFQSYPVQYYLNNYNGNGGFNGTTNGQPNGLNSSATNDIEIPKTQAQIVPNGTDNFSNIPIEQIRPENQKESLPNNYNAQEILGLTPNNNEAKDYALHRYDVEKTPNEEQNFEKSTSIIKDLNEREDELKAEKKNSKEKRVVALTDEYIKSLENYLNNPNQEIRLMASKEILTRLDEDKTRFDDAALNALLNKMLQDPSKLIRVASLSAFNAQLASGNDYTVHLLNTIQQNPSADKEDVLQAADILLKMSAGTEIRQIPTPEEKDNQPTTKNGDK